MFLNNLKSERKIKSNRAVYKMEFVAVIKAKNKRIKYNLNFFFVTELIYIFILKYK